MFTIWTMYRKKSHYFWDELIGDKEHICILEPPGISFRTPLDSQVSHYISGRHSARHWVQFPLGRLATQFHNHCVFIEPWPIASNRLNKRSFRYLPERKGSGRAECRGRRGPQSNGRTNGTQAQSVEDQDRISRPLSSGRITICPGQ